MIVHTPPGPAGVMIIQILGFQDRGLLWLVLATVAGLIVGLVDVGRTGYRLLAENVGGSAAFYWIREWQWLEAGWIREHELKSLTSSSWYALGIAVTLGLFEVQVTLPALQVLAFGDPAARWFGTRHNGRRFRNGKSWPGYWGFVVGALFGVTLVNVLHAAGFLLYSELTPQLFVGQLLAILAAAAVECQAGHYDNLLIPIAAAAVMSLFV